ncbi:GSCOCG00010946001-RA-CDS, partial [Cotesia congregata]
MCPALISYSDEVKRWFQDNPGRVITANDTPKIYNTAFKSAAKPETIRNGFKKAGICPFDRIVYADKDFV